MSGKGKPIKIIARMKTSAGIVIRVQSFTSRRRYNVTFAKGKATRGSCSCQGWIYKNPRENCTHIKHLILEGHI